MFVVGVLAVTFLLVATGLRAQGDDRSRGQREDCLLGSFFEEVETNGMTLKALVTFSPGGCVIRE